MPCVDLPAPHPRRAGDNPPHAEVPRADVEHLIAGVLHEAVCDGQDYAPEYRRADRAGHAADAQAICDALAGRGWTVHRTQRS